MKKIEYVIKKAVTILTFTLLIVSSIGLSTFGADPIDDGGIIDPVGLQPKNPTSPVIACSPGFFDFGQVTFGGTLTTTFDIYNIGIGVLDWELSIPDFFKPYVSVSPNTGSSQAPERDSETNTIIGEFDKTTVTVTINTRNMLYARYTLSLIHI